MAYDPEKGKEMEYLPKDSVLDATIVEIADGKTEDFVKNLQKWQGDPKSPAINITMACMVEDSPVTLSQVFTYAESGGKTAYSANSNLGKYVRKYGNLPKVGDKIKIMTDKEGFGKVKVD